MLLSNFIFVSAGYPKIWQASVVKATQSWRSLGFPCKNAVLTSAVNKNQPWTVMSTSTKILDMRKAVGLLVSREPASASGSLNPWITNRAFARGVPSGFFGYFRRNRPLSVRLGSGFPVKSAVQTPFSKKLSNSDILAFMNCARS